MKNERLEPALVRRAERSRATHTGQYLRRQCVEFRKYGYGATDGVNLGTQLLYRCLVPHTSLVYQELKRVSWPQPRKPQ